MRKSTGLSWISPSVTFSRSSVDGDGAIAVQNIRRGEVLSVFGGWIIPLSEFEALPEAVKPYPYQISDELLFGPREEEELSFGECWNHSCEPNAGFRSETTLVAIREINAGQEITFDYAMCMSSPIVNMTCNCGSRLCRGAVLANDWQNLALQMRYRGYFQPYLERKIGFDQKWRLRAALHSLSTVSVRPTKSTQQSRQSHDQQIAHLAGHSHSRRKVAL